MGKYKYKYKYKYKVIMGKQQPLRIKTCVSLAVDLAPVLVQDPEEALRFTFHFGHISQIRTSSQASKLR